MKKDNLYSQPLSPIGDFVFDERVADIFSDMVERSVPGYNAVIAMTGILAEQYVTADSQCYDLGCSLGAVTRAIQQKIDKKNVRIIAVDNSPAMVEKCRGKFEDTAGLPVVEVLCEDISDIQISKASMVVLNFTLQFVEQKKRKDILKKIYQGMIPGGIIVISEKIAFKQKTEQDFQTKLYESFKRINGYSELEIAQKRTALEKVLIPDTLEQHQQRLKEIGFKRFHVWFQCFNFVSMTAFK